MKKIFTAVFLLLSIFSLHAKSIDKKEIIKNVIQNNSFIGYKGEVIIEYTSYEDGEVFEDRIEVSGMKYKAYIDVVDGENQKIVFYKDKNRKQLEIILVNKKIALIYDGKDITKDFEKYKKELLNYPPDFWIFMDGNYIPTSLLTSVNITSYSYILEDKNNIADENEIYINDGNEGVYIDKYYRITGFFGGDYEVGYVWRDKYISKISESSYSESMEITFLDENGWIKK